MLEWYRGRAGTDLLVLSGLIATLARHNALRCPIVEIIPVAVLVPYVMNAPGVLHRGHV